MVTQNWQDDNGWGWSPQEKPQPTEQTPVTRRVAVRFGGEQRSVTHPTDQRLTLPDLSKWRAYWTEDGDLDCGGWLMRSVDGFLDEA